MHVTCVDSGRCTRIMIPATVAGGVSSQAALCPLKHTSSSGQVCSAGARKGGLDLAVVG